MSRFLHACALATPCARQSSDLKACGITLVTQLETRIGLQLYMLETLTSLLFFAPLSINDGSVPLCCRHTVASGCCAMSHSIVKTYCENHSASVRGREASGHADVAVKYTTYHNVTSNITHIHRVLGCSARDNVPVEQCPECQEVLAGCCATCTCSTWSLVLTLASCGILAICLFPLWYGPRCSFRYITESAASAVLRLTGGLTSSGPPLPGQHCFVFGKKTPVVEDKSGGTYSLSPLQLVPLST